MKTWSEYLLADGTFTGVTFRLDDADLSLNIRPGMAAAEGIFDRFSQRVEVLTGEVIDYQPPPPGDTDLEVWEWNASTKRWHSSPTEAAIAAAARADRDRLLAACDWMVTRAMETGQPLPAEWSQYRSNLRDVAQQPGFPVAIDWPPPPS